jgi:hypothetical protein
VVPLETAIGWHYERVERLRVLHRKSGGRADGSSALPRHHFLLSTALAALSLEEGGARCG